jgi:protein-S-isoprenylcysteine O-methyltransferase Ste14
MLVVSSVPERLDAPFAVSESTIERERRIDETWTRLAQVQVMRRHVLTGLGMALVPLLPWVSSSWVEDGVVHQAIEWLGLALMAVAVLGRCGCMLYLGGRKGGELISEGPYSISRNPLYLFSIAAVLGIGLQTGSFVVGIVLRMAVFAVFRRVIAEEERLLQAVFGERFKAYCERVPRFGPRPSLWVSGPSVPVDVAGVWNTLRDALPYFLAIPVFELIEYAQQVGWVPVLWVLP